MENELIKQAALELDTVACGELSADTIICSGENFYIVFGNVFKKSKAKGNNFGSRICSMAELLSALKKRAHKAPCYHLAT